MSILDKVNTLRTSLTQFGTADVARADARIPLTQKGVANGIATLDATAKVPAAQIPDMADDVLTYANLAAFPATGVSGVIYLAVNAGTPASPTRQYRWGGSAYSEIAASPGTTDVMAEGATNKYSTMPRVVASVLTGINTALTGAVAAADNVLQGLGRMQKQISDFITNIMPLTGGTMVGDLKQPNRPRWRGTLGEELISYKTLVTEEIVGGMTMIFTGYGVRVPITGVYLIEYGQLVANGGGSAMYFYLLINDNIVKHAWENVNIMRDLGFTLMMRLNANDVVSFQLSSNANAAYGGAHSHAAVTFIG